MADPRYASRFRYLDAADVDDAVVRFDGLEVVDADGERIGEIDGFVVDADARRVNHIVVDSGGWFTSGRLLPIGHAAVAPDGNLYAPMSRVMHSAGCRSSMPIGSRVHRRRASRLRTPHGDRVLPRPALEEVSTPNWGHEFRDHYRQPEWWGMHYAPERLQSIDTVFAASCSGDRLASVVAGQSLTEDLLGDGLQLQVGGAS